MPRHYLAISEQRWEVEEERLAQGHRLDGAVEILASEQLHLGTERERDVLMTLRWHLHMRTTSQAGWENVVDVTNQASGYRFWCEPCREGKFRQILNRH